MDYSKNLLVKVAELYYNQNMNQQQIANKLKISRVKVSRLLSEAKNRGIVQIEIKYPTDNCIKLESEIEEKYELEEAVIISSKGKSCDLVYKDVTNTVAQIFKEKVNDKDIIGIAWGRTLKHVTDKVSEIKKEVKIVQLLGNIGSSDVSGDVIVRNLANSFQGEILLLPTPAIVDNIEIKKAIMSDGNISNIFETQRLCTLAVVGIGEVSEESTLVMSNYLSKEDLNELKIDGAVGEVCGMFVDKDGGLCNTSINNRVLGINFDDLKNISCVVAVATGREKSESIKAVLKSGIIDVIVTDETTAKRILQK
ncbi:MAG: sugar-binding transcriptional regulator [Eubacteriaceae bacterium]